MSSNVTNDPRVGRVYQLTEDSVTLTRMVGVNEDGIPREETVCALAKHERFVDPAGNICTVPLRTGRVLAHTAQDEQYEMLQRLDQIKAGSLPLGECPYTTEYRRHTPGRATLLGEVPEGVKPCGGAPEGCEHLLPVIAKRLAATRRKHDAQEATGRMVSVEAAEAMMRSFGEGIATGGGRRRPDPKANLQGPGES